MKLLWSLAFLAVVCAIPRPGQLPVSKEAPVQLQAIQGPGRGNNEVGQEQGVSPSEQPSPEPGNSEEAANEDNDDDQEPSLEDLVNALNSIREAIRKKIHNQLGHNNEDSDESHVPSGGGSVDQDSANESNADVLQPGNNNSEGPENRRRRNNNSQPQNSSQPENNNAASNTTNGIITISHQRPNITQIQQAIHDKIDEIIANVLRPWLGNNNSSGNETALAPPQQGNNSALAPPQQGNNSGSGNDTAPAPSDDNNDQNSNGSAPDAPQPSDISQTEPRPTEESGEVSNNTEAASSNLVEVNDSSNDDNEAVIDNEISNVVPAERLQVTIAETSEAQVRVANA